MAGLGRHHTGGFPEPDPPDRPHQQWHQRSDQRAGLCLPGCREDWRDRSAPQQSARITAAG